MKKPRRGAGPSSSRGIAEMRVTATHTDTIPQSVAQRTAQKKPRQVAGPSRQT